jgi:hypothetical protein
MKKLWLINEPTVAWLTLDTFDSGSGWKAGFTHKGLRSYAWGGFGAVWLPTARRTLAGYEAMSTIRKGQVRSIRGWDMRVHATFVAGLFGIAA